MLRYYLNFSTFHTTAKHFYLVIEYFFLCLLNVLLTQVIIRSFSSSSFQYKTASNSSPDTFVYKINNLSKLKYTIIGAMVSLVFMTSKAFCLVSVHSNSTDLPFSFLVSLYMDLVISKNPLIYYQQQENKSSLDLSFFRLVGDSKTTIFMIFLGSILIPSAKIICSRNHNSFCVNLHFFSFIIKNAACKASNTNLTYSLYSSKFLKQIMILFRYTRINLLRYFCSTWFIRR